MKHNFFADIFLIFWVVFSSCASKDKFPVTVNDIDTLSVYHQYANRLQKATVPATEDTVIRTGQSKSNDIQTSGKWTLCTGVFRIKENAIKKFREVNHVSGACVIIRDSMHYVTTGLFSTKDSALQFRNSHQLFDTYLLRILLDDRLLHSFPE
jgi:hypothetical protein